ncbi:MAG: hypothetical protein ACRD3N_12755 [Terracidiphilus sp.]
MQEHFDSTTGLSRRSPREPEDALAAHHLLSRFQLKAARATIHTQEIEERLRLRLLQLGALWPVALGFGMGCYAPQMHKLLAQLPQWVMWLVFPFAILAGRPELHLYGEVSRILPLIAVYAQFPIEGLLARYVLRNSVTVPDVAREVLLFHFLGVAQLWLVSGALAQLTLR